MGRCHCGRASILGRRAGRRPSLAGRSWLLWRHLRPHHFNARSGRSQSINDSFAFPTHHIGEKFDEKMRAFLTDGEADYLSLCAFVFQSNAIHPASQGNNLNNALIILMHESATRAHPNTAWAIHLTSATMTAPRA